MTDENTTETESLESETDVQEAPTEKVSLEDSIRSAFSEAKGDKEVQGDESKEGEKPPLQQERPRAKDGKFKKGKVKTYDFNNQTREATPQQTDTQSQQQAEIEPIHYWTVETKEWFNKQPGEYKKQLIKEAKEREAHTTKLWQNLQRQNQRYSGIDQVIQHYAPKWHEKGFDEVTALRQLAAHYDNLESNPLQAIYNVMAQKGLSLDDLHNFVQTGGQIPQQNYPSQQDSVLRSEVEQLKSIILGAQQEQAQAVVSSAVSEINTLRNEKTQDGRYKYPKLWDSQYLTRVQPLVEQVRQTYPGITWRDATLKAHQAIEAWEGNLGSPSPNNTKLSQSQELQRAKQASVSVRSRGSAQITPVVHKPKPKEKIEDSIRASIAQMEANGRY